MPNVRRVEITEFLEKAGPILEEREAENNLLLGLSSQIASGERKREKPPWLMVLEREGKAVAGALMTPPNLLVIPRLCGEAQAKLLDFLLSEKAPLPGINGPKESARAFAHEWEKRSGGKAEVLMEMRVYEARSVAMEAPVAGRLRSAEAADLDRLTEWGMGFDRDIHAGCLEEGPAREHAQDMLNRRNAFIWEDPDPCCMAVVTRKTANGICISGVYTPPEFRRRGHATAAVAELTRSLLKEGRKFVCLYTDLGNPTSNSIYVKIGYKPVRDCTALRFILGQEEES